MGHPAIAWRSWAPAAAALLAALAAGCAADAPGEPDGAPAPGMFSCELDPAPGSDPFELAVGHLAADGSFEELTEGDDLVLVEGRQRLVMLDDELRAMLPVEADAVCLACTFELGAAEGFEGAEATGGPVQFRAGADGRFGAAPLVIFGSAKWGRAAEGAESELTVRCDGHDLTAEKRLPVRIAVRWLPDPS